MTELVKRSCLHNSSLEKRCLWKPLVVKLACKLWWEVVAEHVHQWLDRSHWFAVPASGAAAACIDQRLGIIRRWKAEHSGEFPGFEQSGLMAIELLRPET